MKSPAAASLAAYFAIAGVYSASSQFAVFCAFESRMRAQDPTRPRRPQARLSLIHI